MNSRDSSRNYFLTNFLRDYKCINIVKLYPIFYSRIKDVLVFDLNSSVPKAILQCHQSFVLFL